MRKIGDAAFFRIVDRLLEPGTSRTPTTNWSIDGVEWQRERHSYAGASHGFTVEVTTGKCKHLKLGELFAELRYNPLAHQKQNERSSIVSASGSNLPTVSPASCRTPESPARFAPTW